jgi:hypothetical protein
MKKNNTGIRRGSEVMKEAWGDFMDRAKANGVSPATQAQMDKEHKERIDELNVGLIANVIQPKPDDAADRVCICQFDGDDNLVVRTYGPSPTELEEAHKNHKCGMWCNICYEEAMKTLCDLDPDTCHSIPPGSCGQDCHGFVSRYSRKQS